MAVQHFSELIVWQKAMDLVESVYRLSEPFPQREVFGLANQMRRFAVSIPSNIAEGQGRETTKEFIRYLFIARGSLQELQTQIMLAGRLALIPTDAVPSLLKAATEVARILHGLIRSLRGAA